MDRETHGLARQYIDPETMEYWLSEGWTEHQIRHWVSTQWAQRGDQGKTIRSNRKGKTMTADKLKAKMEKDAIISDRRTYRDAVCDCFPLHGSPSMLSYGPTIPQS